MEQALFCLVYSYMRSLGLFGRVTAQAFFWGFSLCATIIWVTLLTSPSWPHFLFSNLVNGSNVLVYHCGPCLRAILVAVHPCCWWVVGLSLFALYFLSDGMRSWRACYRSDWISLLVSTSRYGVFRFWSDLFLVPVYYINGKYDQLFWITISNLGKEICITNRHYIWQDFCLFLAFLNFFTCLILLFSNSIIQHTTVYVNHFVYVRRLPWSHDIFHFLQSHTIWQCTWNEHHTLKIEFSDTHDIEIVSDNPEIS